MRQHEVIEAFCDIPPEEAAALLASLLEEQQQSESRRLRAAHWLARLPRDAPDHNVTEPPADASGPALCEVCETRPPGYRLHDARHVCLRCFVRSRRVVRRALGTALAVGTVLVLINQGDLLLGGALTGAHLTTWGALSVGRLGGLRSTSGGGGVRAQ